MRKYLEKSGSACPFCESSGLSSGPIQADGPACAAEAASARRRPVAWSEVECKGCGASWQDVWALVDIDEVKGEHGEEVKG